MTRRHDEHEIIWIVEIPNDSAPCTPRRADICQDLGVADVMYLSLSLSCLHIIFILFIPITRFVSNSIPPFRR